MMVIIIIQKIFVPKWIGKWQSKRQVERSQCRQNNLILRHVWIACGIHFDPCNANDYIKCWIFLERKRANCCCRCWQMFQNCLMDIEVYASCFQSSHFILCFAKKNESKQNAWHSRSPSKYDKLKEKTHTQHRILLLNSNKKVYRIAQKPPTFQVSFRYNTTLLVQTETSLALIFFPQLKSWLVGAHCFVVCLLVVRSI